MRSDRLGPLDPIYDVDISYGAIAAGNTPGYVLLTVTINKAAAQADPTSTSPILFDVVFSEATASFATGDVLLGGTAGGTLAGVVTGSGTTYTVSVSGMTTSGTVTANVPAGVCTSISSGVPNRHSTSTDNSVAWIAVPVLPVSGAWGWWDATYPASVHDSGGGAVSQWDDLSGNLRHFVQATTGNMPTTGARTIGGLNALDFVQANNSYMLCTGITNTPVNLDEWTMYFVYQSDLRSSTHPVGYTLWGVGSTTGFGGRGLSVQPSRFVTTVGEGFATFVGAGGSGGFAGNAFTNRIWGAHTTVARVSEALVEIASYPQLPGWQSDSGSWPTGVTENAGLTINSTNLWATATSPAVAYVGQAFDNGAINGTNSWDGALCEIVIYRRALTPTERTQMRTYLQVKYGL